MPGQFFLWKNATAQWLSSGVFTHRTISKHFWNTSFHEDVFSGNT